MPRRDFRNMTKGMMKKLENSLKEKNSLLVVMWSEKGACLFGVCAAMDLPNLGGLRLSVSPCDEWAMPKLRL
jgi:hypothetical protein